MGGWRTLNRLEWRRVAQALALDFAGSPCTISSLGGRQSKLD